MTLYVTLARYPRGGGGGCAGEAWWHRRRRGVTSGGEAGRAHRGSRAVVAAVARPVTFHERLGLHQRAVAVIAERQVWNARVVPAATCDQAVAAAIDRLGQVDRRRIVDDLGCAVGAGSDGHRRLGDARDMPALPAAGGRLS